MAASASETHDRRSWRVWAIALLLAALWHVLVFLFNPPWRLPAPAPRVEIAPIDPKALERIREQWKKNPDGKLLLNKDRSKPREDVEPPKDARYITDRNQRVEREQRARDTQVIPKPGAPGPKGAAKPPRERKLPAPHPRPDLGKLGVALPTAPSRPEPPSSSESRETRGGEEGGNQWVDEPDLPIGGETMLNARESVFYSFYARIMEAVGPNWQSLGREALEQARAPIGEYVGLVEIVLTRDGSLDSLRWFRSTGVRLFDDAIDRAWRRIARFPNPPNALIESDGRVHLRFKFTYEVTPSGPIRILPPERSYW